MRYSPQIYAQALGQIISDQSSADLDLIVKNFKFVLVKNGDIGQLPKILEILEDILTKKSGGRVVVFETARSLLVEEIQKLKSYFNDKDVFRYKINPFLVAGVRVMVNGNRELDLSFSRRLHNIFK